MSLEEMLAAITAHTTEHVLVDRAIHGSRDSEARCYIGASVHGRSACDHGGGKMLASASTMSDATPTPEAVVASVIAQLADPKCRCSGCEQDRALEADGAAMVDEVPSC